MNPNMAYYAIDTKILTKKRHIFKEIEWDKVLECSSAEQLRFYLSLNKEFKKFFESNKNEKIDRDIFEVMLGKFKTSEIENLLHYFSGSYKDFLKTLFIEDEIKDLSLILRKLAREENLDGIEERFMHSDKFTSLPFKKLLESKNIVQLTECLKGTPYYIGLRNLTNEDAIKREFHIEMKLYVVLYQTLMLKAEDLYKEDKKTAKDIIGSKIDFLNIQWIYRAIKYFKITPEEILNYSLEGGKSIDYNSLKKLCYCKTIDEFKKLLKTILSFDIFKDLNDSDIDIDVITDSFMFNYLQKNVYKNIGTVISFIYMLDILINDLTTITEGIEYRIPKNKLKNYLAFNIK